MAVIAPFASAAQPETVDAASMAAALAAIINLRILNLLKCRPQTSLDWGGSNP
jgi:hypothetical protein